MGLLARDSNLDFKNDDIYRYRFDASKEFSPMLSSGAFPKHGDTQVARYRKGTPVGQFIDLARMGSTVNLIMYGGI